VSDVPLEDRYRGCLLGLAVGDALGGPVEFMSSAEISARHGRLREMVGGGWLELAPGEYTDDTQLALVIARSIARLGSVAPADIAGGFVAWYRSAPKDVGNTTSRSIRHLIAGASWREAGRETDRAMGARGAGNGSLMRTAPIALACWPDREALDRLGREVSAITHANRLATGACVAFDRALAAVLEGAGDPLAAAAGVDDADVRAVVLAVPDLSHQEVRSGGFVLETLQAALWSCARHDDFEETVVEAVNLGGDADTTGAVAGALAGACYGVSAIPARWLSVLQGRDELVALADRLLEVARTGQMGV